MKITKAAQKLANDLGLSDVDAYMMEFKATLYRKSSDLIKCSKLTHQEIAHKMGTSRSRINRIANYGENNISIELLIKLITTLQGRAVIKIAS